MASGKDWIERHSAEHRTGNSDCQRPRPRARPAPPSRSRRGPTKSSPKVNPSSPFSFDRRSPPQMQRIPVAAALRSRPSWSRASYRMRTDRRQIASNLRQNRGCIMLRQSRGAPTRGSPRHSCTQQSVPIPKITVAHLASLSRGILQ